MINIDEHKSASYAPRTYVNASKGVTLAIAADFTTAGEKLTTKAASKYGIVHLDARKFATGWLPAARELYKLLVKHNIDVVNVAGNGIYTLSKHGITQREMNAMVYTVLKMVHTHRPLSQVVSGGQTGADLAGLVVAAHLGIECSGLWPNGYRMRFEDKVDRNHTPQEIMDMINQYADDDYET